MINKYYLQTFQPKYNRIHNPPYQFVYLVIMNKSKNYNLLIISFIIIHTSCLEINGGLHRSISKSPTS